MSISSCTLQLRPRAKLMGSILARQCMGLPTSKRYSQAAAAIAESNDDSISSSIFQPSVDEYWRKIPTWNSVTVDDFLSYRWSIANTVQGVEKLARFLHQVVPDTIPYGGQLNQTRTRAELVKDVLEGTKMATMAVRITPYTLSRINWHDPLNDPVFRQFIPTKSTMIPDHPALTRDPLEESDDSPVAGLVHRYPDKALFLAVSVCPAYCMYCTRSKNVGADTEALKKDSMKPSKTRWEEVFAYIESQPGLHDIVVSGGDSYYLQPDQLFMIGKRLLDMPNIRRLRFASKGLAVAPGRILDPRDDWAKALIAVAHRARVGGKSVALHTHFNHPNEIAWITEAAAQKLFEAGVTVRNQAVLLRGVNDDVATMSSLIRLTGDQYYVFQTDMVNQTEHLRTPLQTIIDLEAHLRGSIAGFMMPQFVVDLPGGGGKRLACSYISYDRQSGVSEFTAPTITGRNKENKVYKYYDPLDMLPSAATPTNTPLYAAKGIGSSGGR
ncbi:putative L-lysine-aminomutase [Seiridium cardinale]|uniref:L-lysine-aminomutase n=1 Tax=Seiridium cardinale TaxID=138064 RepID=A0ABR2XE58_9PEZI